MTSFENPKAIRHFQSICDSCQDLVTRFHTPADLKLYSDVIPSLKELQYFRAKGSR